MVGLGFVARFFKEPSVLGGASGSPVLVVATQPVVLLKGLAAQQQV